MIRKSLSCCDPDFNRLGDIIVEPLRTTTLECFKTLCSSSKKILSPKAPVNVTYGRMITQIISPHLLGYLNIYRNIKIFNYIQTYHNIQIERPNI